VKPADLLALLQAFYRDKLALRLRHEAAARAISGYDINNTYQYVINRDEGHLGWLRSAISDLGGDLPAVAESEVLAPGKKDQSPLMREDSAQTQAFVDRWRDRIETITNARVRGMLRVILGESLEQKRFFDQAAEGRSDLLGRRMDGAGTGGGVLPTRWME
jgi:hypothetical protein